MVRAIIASDRLLPHSNGRWGPITTAPFSRLYTQSFHFNLRHRDDGHASGELRGLHRGKLPLLPYHHNHYQQQPSHRVMWCLGAVIIQLGDGRWWQCLGLCCLNDFSLGEVLQLKTKVESIVVPLRNSFSRANGWERVLSFNWEQTCNVQASGSLRTGISSSSMCCTICFSLP